MVAVDRASLVRSIAKVAIDLCDLKVGSAIKGVVDATGAFKPDGPGEPTAAEGARLLLQRAAYAAAVRVIQAQARKAPVLAAEADPREIEAALTGVAAGAALELTAAAFADPESWPAVAALLELFDRLTKAGGVDEATRLLLRRAYADALPLGLAGEWAEPERAGDYHALKAELERRGPFDDAAQRALDWRAYRDRLIRAVDAPMRTLAPELIRCSLSDLYVPLRAMVGDPDSPEERGRRGEEGKRRILWLDEALYGWATQPNPARTDAFRVLSGEPGAGKSSACAMLAARLAKDGRRVLLVPLARLNIRGDSLTELSRHLTAELGHDALDQARGAPGEPLVLILDGLDELAKAGQGATALLGGFVAQLGAEIRSINQDRTRVLLLLAGRPGAAGSADSIVRAEGARLHVLRYRIDREEQHRFEDATLAALDQREDWWRRFAPAQGMPEPLHRSDPHIESLTEQPLLNWLLGQILTLEGADKAAELRGVHDLYSRLFDHVLSRAHRRDDDDGSSEAIDAAKREQLEHMLEEVAVAAWHTGGDRSVPVKDLIERLGTANLIEELERLADKRDHALTTLLDSFFCRAHPGAHDRVVEFTHKSFGQFLTARRLVREVRAIHRRLGEGGDADDALLCLTRWLKLCGPAAMDHAVFDFLGEEVRAAAERGQDVGAWQTTLVPLVTDCLVRGMPLPSGESRARSTERRTRNAEAGLLAALGAIIRIAGWEGSRVKLDAATLNDTLHRLFGPRAERSVIRRSAHVFDLRGANLGEADLMHADLSCANLSRADVQYANLANAELWNANLTGANLSGTDLTQANLSEANLTSVGLWGADLRHADLMSANLTDANLTGADLTGANLSFAKLTGADLRHACLKDADLTRADLGNADLTSADLTGAELAGANLAGADFWGAIGKPTNPLPEQLPL